jgi:hypothetical protein
MHGNSGVLADIEQLLEGYESPLLGVYRGTLQAVGLLLASGWRRWRVARRVRRLLAGDAAGPAMMHLVHDRLASAGALYRFNACERLFALWHLLHMPLFIMLVATGIIHVIAVHLY